MPTPEPRDPTRVARQAQMRDQNLGVALRGIVEAVEPLSRAQLAASEGLARATVSGLVDHLIEARLVRELEPTQTQRAGRPAVPLAPARGTVAGVGMEVNVDYLGVRAIDLAGDVLAEHVELDDLRGADADEVLDRLAALAAPVVEHLRARGVRVAGTALALPGLVDRITGPLRVAPNLGWSDVDVVARVSAHPTLASLPPRVGNEANLAARAEAHARRGPVAPSFAYVSGEIGIGGALVLDGNLFPGRHGWSGEIGHVVVDAFRGPRASDGTLEALAGQDAMLRAAGLPPTARLDALLDALEADEPRA
ncbi:ROK family protein, partial [Cellulomonas sp. P5_C6]